MSTQPDKRSLPESAPTEGLSTGSLALDLKLGTCGWPRGRIVEIFGWEGTGKTTLLLEAIAHAQRDGGIGAFIDADHATNLATARRLGVNEEGMFFEQISSLDDAFEKIDGWVKGGSVDVIALDGIFSLLTENHNSCSRDTIPHRQNQDHQHRLDYFLKTLLGPLSRSRAVLLISNRLVEKIGVMFGSPEMTPWETMPLRSYASVRVQLVKSAAIKMGDDTIGTEIRAKIVKNRLAPPLKQVELELLFATGISEEADLLTLGLETGLITKRGPGQFLYAADTSLGAGRINAARSLCQDPELAARLRAEILERLNA